jgi:hypothetical protein
MTDRRLQKRYFVTGLQPQLAYNVVMSPTAHEQRDARGRGGLVAMAFVGIGVLAGACGGGHSTTTGSAATRSGSSASLSESVLAYVNCMRTHGEPTMPDPTISQRSGHVSLHISATPGSVFKPNARQFATATNACQHLLAKVGGTPGGSSITPAEPG